MNRQNFLKTGLISTAAFLTSSHAFSYIQDNEDPPQLDKKLVQEFVGASHGKMDVVKPLLEEYPTLLNAAHDWRQGDFETGLGAASHVGYKELVLHFLEKGAQANIFTAALFGRLDILKPMLEFSPGLLHAKGPHGYTLLHHAEKGKNEAENVKEFLLSKGLTETKVTLY